MKAQSSRSTWIGLGVILQAMVSLCIIGCDSSGGGGGAATATPEPADPAIFVAAGDDADVWELYAVEPDGENLRRISGEMVEDGDVEAFYMVFTGTQKALSPDGEYVAYIADQDVDRMTALYVSDCMGENNRRVSMASPPQSRVLSFAWSPDGMRLAYAIRMPDGVQELHTVRWDGTGDRRIFLDDGNGAAASSYKWAPDGRSLACVLGLNPARVCHASADGSVVTVVDEAINYGFISDWSGDGAGFIYTLTSTDLGTYYYNVASEMKSVLTPLRSRGEPFLSRDARSLALIVSRETLLLTGLSNIDLIEVQFPADVSEVLGVSWSPDGSSLIASTKTDSGVLLFRMAADGDHLTQVGPEFLHGSHRVRWVGENTCLIHGPLRELHALNIDTEMLTLIGDSAYAEAFSEDLERIAIVQFDSETRKRSLLVMDLSEDTLVSIFESERAGIIQVVWSSDAERVIIWLHEDGASSLYSCKRDGSEFRELSTGLSVISKFELQVR